MNGRDETGAAAEAEAEKAPYHEPYKSRAANTFPVMELFGPTIQGEGIMIGEKTMFIRLGGCDYRCKMCDSMHAVDPQAVKAHATWCSAEQIAASCWAKSPSSKTPWVTISGGNPAMWDLQDLVFQLQEVGYKVAVETQGSIWRDWLATVDCLTISPKAQGMGERFDEESFVRFLEHVENSAARWSGDLAVCIKIPAFSVMDLEFVASVSQILDNRNKLYEEHTDANDAYGLLWPEGDRYISLGNPYPPKLNPETLKQELNDYIEQDLVSVLLSEYRVLLEDYLLDKRLRHWKFLPQLHVLIWGNKAGV